MKVEKLISKNQPQNWFEKITQECGWEYPIHLVDIDSAEKVIDMGCNVGGFSEAFNHRFNNILAIDAASYNVEQYKSRHPHTILHKAVSSKDGELVKLKKYMGYGDDDTNSGNFSITGFVYDNADQHGFRGDEYEEVETISLETILDMVGDIGLLKIDIEGAEVDVLNEITDENLLSLRCVSCEFHKTYEEFDEFENNFCKRMNQLGFNGFTLYHGNGDLRTLNFWKK
jgi:FkbM family methyltransferase